MTGVSRGTRLGHMDSHPYRHAPPGLEAHTQGRRCNTWRDATPVCPHTLRTNTPCVANPACAHPSPSSPPPPQVFYINDEAYDKIQ